MLLSDEATNQSETHCGLQNREDTPGFCLLHMRENANEVTHSFGDCPFLHLNQTFVANRQEKHANQHVMCYMYNICTEDKVSGARSD